MKGPVGGMLFPFAAQDAGDGVLEDLFARSLRSIRTHLGMDVAFISEFADGRRYFRHVDSRLPDGRLIVGGSDRLNETYCQRVVDGRMPELIPDTRDDPEAWSMEATRLFPVGAHMGVPIRLSDGSIFGTFCCFSTRPDRTLNVRDLEVMRAFAEVVAGQIERDVARRGSHAALLQRVDTVLRPDALSTVFQPIVHVGDDRIVGFEALTRFLVDPPRTPDAWFAEAARAGRGAELETLAIRKALPALQRFPEPVYLSVNASPAMIVQGGLDQALAGVPLRRIVVEVTEHEAVEQYDELAAVVHPLQARGLRVAIDDAGAGYASFRHILNLAPHMIKLDTSITRGIDGDRSRRALAAALCRFAEETGCRIVAEGVETAEELAALRKLGIEKAQGYFLGRPMPLEDAARLCR